MTLGFDGEVVVVTGGGRGMGRAHGRALAARGAQVVVVDVDAAAAASVADEITLAGGTAAAVEVAASSLDAERVVARSLEQLGRIDAIVNNAGVAHLGALATDTDADLERLLDVHLRTPVRLARAAWSELARRRGRIVNVVSNAALFGKGDMSSYAASKGALVAWTRSLALEGAPDGVRVNAVAPIAATRLTSGLLGELEHRLTPERVTPVVVWLAHRDVAEQGAVISVAGGAIARVVAARVAMGTAATAEEVGEALGTSVDLSTATLPGSAADEVVDVRRELALG